MAWMEWVFYLLIPSFILLHLVASPYTKVEESFNIQAIHDILIHGIPRQNPDQFFTANYDHVSFPGSVPRTFVGALLLSGLSRPWVVFLDSPEQLQLLARGVLGVLNAGALIAFARSVRTTFGTGAGIWYALFQASQFHVIYYASRTLPNMFAFIFSNIALRSLLNAYTKPWEPTASRNCRLALYLLTFAGVVFRSELAILVGTVTLYLLATRRLSIGRVILPAGIGGAFVGLLSTVPIDSYFWQSKYIWPEFIAFWYNTVQGHSAEWGVSPWHFYFRNALPRLMMNPATYLLCIPIALLNASTRGRSLDVMVPLLGFVGLFSFLPHKEWRFIIYVIPGLTAIAAAGASWIWTRRGKSVVYAILSLVLVASVLASFIVSTALLAVSSLNYPGGEAIHYLHHHMNHSVTHPRVYFDNLACQTGVTRFLEIHERPQTVTDFLETHGTRKTGWVYDKTEDPETLLDPMFWTNFDYVLAEKPEKIIGAWSPVHTVYGFGGVTILKPREESESPTESHEQRDDQHWTSKVADSWRTLEGLVRYRFLKGWWAELRMEPRIQILENIRD